SARRARPSPGCPVPAPPVLEFSGRKPPASGPPHSCTKPGPTGISKQQKPSPDRDMSRIDESRPFIPVGIAVLTVSDTRTPADDRSGDTHAARIAEAGHVLKARAIATDDRQKIAAQVRAWTLDPTIDVVITT